MLFLLFFFLIIIINCKIILFKIFQYNNNNINYVCVCRKKSDVKSLEKTKIVPTLVSYASLIVDVGGVVVPDDVLKNRHYLLLLS